MKKLRNAGRAHDQSDSLALFGLLAFSRRRSRKDWVGNTGVDQRPDHERHHQVQDPDQPEAASAERVIDVCFQRTVEIVPNGRIV
jgi:hypothetical protein